MNCSECDSLQNTHNDPPLFSKKNRPGPPHDFSPPPPHINNDRSLITTKKAIHVVMVSFTMAFPEEAALALSGLFTERKGVSIKIEVASRFEYSDRPYQQGAVGPLFLGGREGVWARSAPENFEISKP